MNTSTFHRAALFAREFAVALWWVFCWAVEVIARLIGLLILMAGMVFCAVAICLPDTVLWPHVAGAAQVFNEAHDSALADQGVFRNPGTERARRSRGIPASPPSPPPIARAVTPARACLLIGLAFAWALSKRAGMSLWRAVVRRRHAE